MAEILSTSPLPAPLPLARYRFTARYERRPDLPEYTGFLLRSVFGAALRRMVCVTDRPQCTGCPLWRTCVYPAIFETPPQPTQFAQQFSAVPNPYVIEPPVPAVDAARNGTLTFNMVLFGLQTLRQLPLIIQAWERALRQGLGRARVPLALDDVIHCPHTGAPTTVWTTGQRTVLPHDPLLPSEAWTGAAGEAAPKELTLTLLTPLRLQSNGKPLHPGELAPRKLVADLLRRLSLIFELHLHVGTPPFDASELMRHAADIQDDRHALRWTEATRYSARQDREMRLGGVIGPWDLRGDLSPLLPWLRLGQWLHVGKSATMGLGRYLLHSGTTPT